MREHQQIPIRPLEPLRLVATTDYGRLSEQRVTLPGLSKDSPRVEVRRLRLDLNTPTCDGETLLTFLTTLPASVADAVEVAALYRERWTVEKAFLHLTTQLRCELKTLAYPSAVLFGFAQAVVAYNALAVIRAALRRTYDAHTIDTQVPGYYLVNEMARVTGSLETLVTPEEWAMFHTLTPQAMANWLLTTAHHVQLGKYRKHSRGTKKPAQPRTHPSKSPTCPLLACWPSVERPRREPTESTE